MNVKDIVYDYARSWPQKEYDYISPSSLGGCMRSHFYKLQGIESTTPPNPGALLNFELGRLWEAPIENALKWAGIPFMSQTRIIDEEWGVGGTIDVALLDGDELELVSIKTEGSKASWYRKKEGISFLNSHPEYTIQEATYKLLLERKGFKVKDTARYVLILKDNGLLDEPILQFTPELMEKTEGLIMELRGYLDNNELPPCTCEGWKVNYCNYGDPDSIEKNKTGKMVPTKCCSKELYVADVQETA